MGQTNQPAYPPLASGDHSWSSATGAAAASWNYPVDSQKQDTVYYDPQRDVSVSGENQTVASSVPPIAQSTHVPYSSSLQHGYKPTEYGNYYYHYPQATNNYSAQQGGPNQHSGAAYQPLTSFQNSGSYVDPTSNTYYNAGGHQTAPGYATGNYYYQNNTQNDGSSGNNYAQSYQNYSSSGTNAVQSSSTVPTNSFQYQPQYNQWPYYHNHSAASPAVNPAAGSSNIDNRVVNTTSGYSYPSAEPPPPGTTSWKSNSGASVAPPLQVCCFLSLQVVPLHNFFHQTLDIIFVQVLVCLAMMVILNNVFSQLFVCLAMFVILDNKFLISVSLPSHVSYPGNRKWLLLFFGIFAMSLPFQSEMPIPF
jgi:hypothetical protein